jgi:glutaconate CoA-transferase subunit A
MIARSLDDALARIADGCTLAVPRESSGVPMAATRALIRRGIKRLHLVALPTSTLQADLLIGAGCIETLETSAVSLGEFGPAPRFTAAILAGTVRMMDATCPALHAQFQAAEKGVPFMPLRGLVGSDVLAHRPDWKILDNPFGNDDPIVLLPALKPDVEKIHDGDLLRDPLLAAGTLPGFYVEAVAVEPRGAWPQPLPDHYAIDGAHMAEYARLAATPEGFADYLERYVHERVAVPA